MRVLFTIIGTPTWANGGRSWKFAPRRTLSLRAFAYAAAKRYSGQFADENGILLPPVRLWTAWNEPNLPYFLKVPGAWRYEWRLTRAYALICNAVVAGAHRAGSEERLRERVACGVTAPRKKPSLSIAPLAFLRAMKRAGAKFDVYAHHPYPQAPSDSPTDQPRARSAVTLGNIGKLVRELTRLYGRKRLWLTEFGYQTRPDDSFWVSRRRQAHYMNEAYALARRHTRIDMLVWFLVRDEPDLNGSQPGSPGWQSGLITAGGKRKASYGTFARLPR
jgi:hypothetical protein